MSSTSVLPRVASARKRSAASARSETESIASQLKTRLEADLKDAMRSGDAARRDALRFVLSAVHDREVEGLGAQALEGGQAVARGLDVVPLPREERGHVLQAGAGIVHDEDALAVAAPHSSSTSTEGANGSRGYDPRIWDGRAHLARRSVVGQLGAR